MNKLLKFGFTLAAGLVISACGSSGGGGDNNTSTTTPAANNPTAQTSTSSNATTTPSNTSTASSSTATVASTGTGGSVVIDDNDSVKVVSINNPSLTTLSIDGKELTIGKPGIYSGGWSTFSTSSGKLAVCCGRYSSMRFGLSFSENENQQDYFFYNGSPTTAMPTSGSATYQGQAIINGGDNYPALDVEDEYVIGSSNFNVNFGAKTLTGSLNFDKLQAVNINANIANNSFNGSANSASLKGTTTVEGKFYGSNAQELGGLFGSKTTGDNSWAGAFGAAKQ